MKVAFLTPSVSRTAGGIFDIERRTAQHLASLTEIQVSVFGTIDQHTEADLSLWSPLRPKVFPFHGPAVFRFSPALKRAFLASDCDLAHANTLWNHTSIILRRWKRKTREPYLITVNGMLDAWAVNHSRLRKQIASLLYERANLNEAACLHVNTEAELHSVREFGLRNPLCIIPNGVDLPAGLPANPSPWTATDAASPVLLYLSRLHPKKNLPNLLTAWAEVQRTHPSGWLLAIVGWDQGGHEAELQQQVAQLGTSDTVRFLGPRFGGDRDACYHHASAVVLPSLSEGLPMAVLEAWAWSKPVLMTPACNLPEGFQRAAALRIETQPAGIACGLRTLFEMSNNERIEMGRRGQALVAEKFTWPKVAADMRSVYEWVLGGGPPPSCVVRNQGV